MEEETMNSRWCVGKGEGEGGERSWEERCAFSAALPFLKHKCRWAEEGIPKSDFYRNVGLDMLLQ